MTKRPCSSVTTILANFVGSSLVSAITQTPASGPPGPRTTPPISSPSIATAAGCARTGVASKESGPAMTAKVTAKYDRTCLFKFMFSPCDYGVCLRLFDVKPTRTRRRRQSPPRAHTSPRVSRRGPVSMLDKFGAQILDCEHDRRTADEMKGERNGAVSRHRAGIHHGLPRDGHVSGHGAEEIRSRRQRQ